MHPSGQVFTVRGRCDVCRCQRGERVPGIDYVRYERRTYYGIGLNVEEILRGTIFKDSPKPTLAQSITEGVLTYVQRPGTVFAVTHAF